MISLLVVESAAIYREQLRSAYYLAGNEEKMQEAAHLPIMFQGINYLAKMKLDTAFLPQSPLSRLFNFSRAPDPFLISAATAYALSKGLSKYAL